MRRNVEKAILLKFKQIQGKSLKYVRMREKRIRNLCLCHNSRLMQRKQLKP